jgi:DNA-binding CsgD family transcriptional regulator
MQQYLLVFYSLFFSTGFMGGTALFILGLRVRSRLIRPLLAFQVLFLLALGIVVVYFYLMGLPGGISPGLNLFLITAVNIMNASIYVVSIILIRRISPPASRRKGFLAVPEIFAGLVIVKTLVNLVLTLLVSTGYSGGPLALADSEAWSLVGYILAGLALAAFGVVARGPLAPGEPPALRPLIRGYGLCALVFAPMGLIEYAVQTAGIPGLPYISLDHLFYLGWNLISMSAAIRIFKPGEAGVPVMDSVPEERIRALGLSAREVEMSIMIARGLANKEIAAELGISPATVRTHIYNLYQKAGARSRVELLNKLRS